MFCAAIEYNSPESGFKTDDFKANSLIEPFSGTDQQRSFDGLITIYIFRPLFPTRIDDAAHRSEAKRLSCTCRQVWVVSAGCRANLFQGSNVFCHDDNIRDTNKECFSGELRSRRWHGLYILAWSSRSPFRQKGFAKAVRGRDHFFDTHVFHLIAKESTIDRISISHQILWCRIPGEGFHYL